MTATRQEMYFSFQYIRLSVGNDRGNTLDGGCDINVMEMMVSLIGHRRLHQIEVRFSSARGRRCRHDRNVLITVPPQRGAASAVRLIVVCFQTSSQVQRYIVDGGYHCAHERRAGEEERPAVAVWKTVRFTCRRVCFLTVRYLVVDCWYVENNSHRQRERWRATHI